MHAQKFAVLSSATLVDYTTKFGTLYRHLLTVIEIDDRAEQLYGPHTSAGVLLSSVLCYPLPPVTRLRKSYNEI